MQSVIQTMLQGVVGALETEVSRVGTTFHRTPAAARSRLNDPMLALPSAVTSGVRIEVETNAPTIELDVDLTRPLIKGTRSRPAAFDLIVDGKDYGTVLCHEQFLVIIDLQAQSAAVEPAGPTTVRFDLREAGPGTHIVELWLPADVAVTFLDARVPDGTVVRPANTHLPLWVHHGSSISQSSEAERPTMTWPAAVARAAKYSLLNLGIAGQCHLDQFMAREIRDIPASVISIEVGINIVNGDSMRERAFTSAFHGFLDTVRDGHPGTPILVMTPIICPPAETHPGPTPLGPDLRVRTIERPAALARGALSLSRIRELTRLHVEQRRKEGDLNLHLVDGLTLLGADDVSLLPDLLHPDAAGYARLAERFFRASFGFGGVLHGEPADARNVTAPPSASSDVGAQQHR
jgi:GDSL-like Lipase/Acylhydrolase family